MNKSPLSILVMGLIVAFFLILVTSDLNQSYVPYNNLREHSSYESMAERLEDYPEERDQENFEPDDEEPDRENFEPIIDVPQTVSYGPFRDSEIIDKFSQVTKNGVDGVDGCISSGLSNSKGYICLTPELVKLLKSRGGNASCDA
jgi:hypothetical protein